MSAVSRKAAKLNHSLIHEGKFVSIYREWKKKISLFCFDHCNNVSDTHISYSYYAVSWTISPEKKTSPMETNSKFNARIIWVRVQPMRNQLTIKPRLSLADPIPWMIPVVCFTALYAWVGRRWGTRLQTTLTVTLQLHLLLPGYWS